jgi:SH3-like domain-containing protein
VVSLEGWSKVRDSEGGLAWIERKFLAEKRSVIVTADAAQVRQTANETAPLVFEAEKNVALDYVETAPGGWVKVHHRDGASGFVRADQIWGL